MDTADNVQIENAILLLSTILSMATGVLLRLGKDCGYFK